MKKTLSFLLLWCAPLLAFGAEPARLERDLGEGLKYVRVRAVPADLPEAVAKPTPMVLDLRYAHAGDCAGAALGAWLQFHSSPKTPVFVLVNGGTAAAILEFLDTCAPIPGFVTLGVASLRFVPDITLKIPSSTERTAYEALDHGASLEALLTDQPGKPRHDEAAIAQEHAADEDTAADDADPSLADARDASVTPAPAPKPVIDATLQRAVQLHRTLKALRKI